MVRNISLFSYFQLSLHIYTETICLNCDRICQFQIGLISHLSTHKQKDYGKINRSWIDHLGLGRFFFSSSASLPDMKRHRFTFLKHLEDFLFQKLDKNFLVTYLIVFILDQVHSAVKQRKNQYLMEPARSFRVKVYGNVSKG